MLNKKFVFISLCSFFLLQVPGQSQVTKARVNVNAKTFYSKIRNWTTPSQGEEPAFNAPSFQWPSIKKAKYSIRLSTDTNFRENLIEKDGIPFAIFNPHQKLAVGKWYWQYKVNTGSWNKPDSFTIQSTTPVFETPAFSTIRKAIPQVHPRVLAHQADLIAFRQRAMTYKESALVLEEADKLLNQLPPTEASTLPNFSGKNDFENDKIALLFSKKSGWHIYNVLNGLSQAYILTGDVKYYNTAKKWMIEISKWDPNGSSHDSDFGDSGIMTGMAIAVDTFWDLLTPAEKESVIKPAAVRANQFYDHWINQVESRSSSMHVWQHIMHRLLYTSLAFMEATPGADHWMEYIYELWIAQSPKMGETDGAWINGTGYFGMNTLTLYDITSIFKQLSGVDFRWSDWYKNNPRWLIYAIPPNSCADGFCNDGNKYPKPTLNYAAYADAAARMFYDPYAAWYAREIAKGFGLTIPDDEEFRWFRIQRGNLIPAPAPVKQFDLPQAARFPDVGVAYMHTVLQDPENDLMLSIRSSPFGSLAHTHADQNSFNIAYGGKRLFYNSGYRPAMGDPHFLGWYKDTRGHNGILIDGMGQPFSEGAYGWIPRFLHGEQVSYAVGDATHAYSGKVEGKQVNLGVQLFRRHYIMLRPLVIVIYDELEADHPAEWSWLLHNDNGLEIDPDRQTILAENDAAKAKVSLFSSSAIDFRVTDQFSVPVDNWTNKVDEEGDTVVFQNQWHFSGVSKQKMAKMRYLAIIQVKPDGSFEPVSGKDNEGDYTVGEWHIQAEMDVTKPAHIQVWNNDNTARLVSDGVLTNKGKEYKGKETGTAKLLETIDGREVFLEVKDEVPPAMQKVMERNKKRK
ncbi:MAG: DUF4962 domain-containing protein [Terrimonas sp.]|nr:DUF4962 domain-containing protein [Terrimonas sp.]